MIETVINNSIINYNYFFFGRLRRQGSFRKEFYFLPSSSLNLISEIMTRLYKIMLLLCFIADECQKMKYNTLLVDFMGSGGSEGNQTTIGFLEAVEVKTAFDYLTKAGDKNIYLFGTSRGSVAIMKAIKYSAPKN